MPAAAKGDGKPEPAKLSKRELSALTTIVSDVRAAVARLRPPACPLDVLARADAVPAMRDLYYALSNEDPGDVMPGRRLLGDWKFAERCALPILAAVHAAPAAADQPKRWAPTLYQTLRLLSMLCVPVEDSNGQLAPGCNLEVHIMDMKHALAAASAALDPLVALLQFYMEKKAESVASLAPAEASKVVDARIENILRFFRNILTPPRPAVDRDLMSRDRGAHIALVGACVRADLFATLSVLFSDEADARHQDTRLVLLVSEIYALAFRHSSARDLALSAARASHSRRRSGAAAAVSAGGAPAAQDEQPPSVFDAAPESSPEDGVPGGAGRVDARVDAALGARDALTATRARSQPRVPAGAAGGLRAALQRERTLVGGGRSVVASGRWTNRHSGGFHVVALARETSPGAAASGAPAGQPAGRAACAARSAKSLTSKRIVSVRNVPSRAKRGVVGVLQVALETNSELLCLLGAKGRPKLAVVSGRSVVARAIRADLVDAGRVALGRLAQDFISECFPSLIRELRERLGDPRQHDEDKSWAGRRFYLVLVATVAGFQREFAILTTPPPGTAAPTLPRGATILNAPLEAALCLNSQVAVDWMAVESAISVDSFKLAFQSVNDARADGKHLTRELELASGAIVEMMKLLHCMAAMPGASPADGDGGVGALGGVRAAEAVPAPRRRAGFSITLGQQQAPTAAGEGGETGGGGIGAPKSPRAPAAAAGVPSQAGGAAVDDGPAATVAAGPDEPFSFAAKLTPREVALNTLEELFEREAFLEAPSALAKEFDPKVHSLRHLANIIEIAFTFNATLLGEDFARITVSRKRKRRRPKPAASSARRKPKSIAIAGAEHDGLNDGAEADGGKGGAAEENGAEDDPFARPGAGGEAHKDGDEAMCPPVEATGAESGEGAPEAGGTGPLAAGGDDERGDGDGASGAGDGAGAADRAEGSEDEHGEEAAAPGSEGEDGDSAEDAAREVEGGDVIRRFATPKSLQHIALALRAALCNTAGVSGSILPMPEGASELFALPIVAKSLVVLQSVWKVVGSRDRGAFRCSYYNFATLHLLGVAMAAAEEGRASDGSILGILSAFGREVTGEFYKALTVNPALLMDALFFPDVSTQRLYAGKMTQLKMMHDENEARERGELRATDDESSEGEERRRRSRKRSSHRPADRQVRLEKQAAAARSARRTWMQENCPGDDVDDFDALDAFRHHKGSDEQGAGVTGDGSGTANERLRRCLKRAGAGDISADSDSGSVGPSGTDGSAPTEEARAPKKRAAKRAKTAGKAVAQRKAKTSHAVEFSSDDGYDDADLADFFGAIHGSADAPRADALPGAKIAAEKPGCNVERSGDEGCGPDVGSTPDPVVEQSSSDAIELELAADDPTSSPVGSKVAEAAADRSAPAGGGRAEEKDDGAHSSSEAAAVEAEPLRSAAAAAAAAAV